MEQRGDGHAGRFLQRAAAPLSETAGCTPASFARTAAFGGGDPPAGRAEPECAFSKWRAGAL